jgi:electron transport complex protein RnfB
LALALFIAAKRFYVWEDPRISQVEGMLPGVNCGGCGKAGCRAFAEAIVAGEKDLRCPVGPPGMMERIGEALGIELGTRTVLVAHVMCEGLESSAAFRGVYHGIQDCRAAHLVGQVEKVCSYGCIGLGSCLSVCQFDAIEIYDGLAHVIPETCVACGKCVEVCPREIIIMLPKGRQVFVPCKALDAGRHVTSYCQIGCIGCGKCAKVCEYDAIEFENNLARVDWERCTRCLACVEACPRDLIKVRDLGRYVVGPEELKRPFDMEAEAERSAHAPAAGASSTPEKAGEA